MTSTFYRDPHLPFIEMRSAYNSHGCYDKHTHQTFSIGMILDGQAQYWNRRAQGNTGCGSVVVINPQEVHACNPRKDSTWAYRMLFIDCDWLANVQYEMGLSRHQDVHMLAPPISNERSLYNGLNHVFEVVLNSSDTLFKEMVLIDFISTLYQKLDRISIENLKSNHRLKQAADFIVAHCLSNISLTEICKITNLSRSYLIRAFKEQYGMTPHAFLLNHRITHAQFLLKKGQSIVHVAHECGFSDQAHFQRVFKRHVAITPKQYTNA